MHVIRRTTSLKLMLGMKSEEMERKHLMTILLQMRGTEISKPDNISDQILAVQGHEQELWMISHNLKNLVMEKVR